jgi:hypothetical protein
MGYFDGLSPKLSVSGPGIVWSAITTSNSDQTVVFRRVKVYGSAGDIKLRNAVDDSDVTFPNVPAGDSIDGYFSRVYTTGTTATSLFGAT